jgi:hypothetical protein
MTLSIANNTAISGGAQAGFTSPTYTFTVDVAPSLYARQWAVSAIGGSQAGVAAHSVSSPFTLTVVRPSSIKTGANVNPGTGLITGAVPKNKWKLIVRKGMIVQDKNPPQVGTATLEFALPAGADLINSGNDIRAMISILTGFLSNQGSGLGDSFVTSLL